MTKFKKFSSDELSLLIGKITGEVVEKNKDMFQPDADLTDRMTTIQLATQVTIKTLIEFGLIEQVERIND